MQQLGRRRAFGGLQRSRSGVVQRGQHADLADRPDALRQAGGRGVRDRAGSRRGVSPRGRPHDRLRGPDHAHAPGQRDDAGVVLRRRAARRGGRGVEQAGSRNRPPMFHPDPSAGKRPAASESLSVRQWWPGGECAGRCHAERAGAIATGSLREYVGPVWMMEPCDYRWVAARNQRARFLKTAGLGAEGIGIMAFAVASQLDPARLSDGELASASAAAQHIAETCLADGSVGRVGLEIEAHCYDPTDPYRRPTWDEITEVLESLPAMPGGSVVTVEPGGAVELSGPPALGATAAIEAIIDDQAVLGKAFAAAGLGLVALGADPLRPAKRINPGARYAAMEQFFRASHTGVAGAAMMTSTASVQVNLDAGPQAGWADRVRLAHALGPVMVAIAANSPLLSGEFTGWRSSRQRVWSQLDSARCGPILTASDEDPGTDWARYALKAPVMLVHSPEAVPVTRRVPFADWADGRELLGGRRPTRHDLEYHLTTLCPPVRPRQWLEIRYLDSVPDDIWPPVVCTLVTLLDDPVAAVLAAEVVEPVATAWDTAARIGLNDQRIFSAANRCVAIAAERAPTELAHGMLRLVDAVEQGRCPADDVSDRVIESGIAATVTELALEEQ